MEPVLAISVSLADTAMYDEMSSLTGNGTHPSVWDCAKPSSYKVAVVSAQKDGTFHEIRTEVIAAVALQGNDADGKRLTQCSLGYPGQVQLVLHSDIAPSETIQVSLIGLPDMVKAQSDGKLKIPSASVRSLTATPQAAPKEMLVNKKTRDTGQLNIGFANTNLFPKRDLPFNTYVRSADLYSTDEKDAKSAFVGTIGLQRGLFPSWYAPIHFEESVQGNQTASNLSNVTSLGFTTLLPWAQSAALFNNSVIQAPLPPDFTVNNQYTHRIRQLVIAPQKALATDDYSLNSWMAWSSISFPWSCRTFAWLGSLGQASTAPTSRNCLGVALNLGAYYLPLDLTSHGKQRVEGYGDVSILVPLSGLSFAARVFPYLTTMDPAKSQIRIQYADTVNAANNYARSKQWTYGIELIK